MAWEYSDGAIGVIGTAALAALGYVVRLGNRVDVQDVKLLMLAQTIEEKKARLDLVATGQAGHETRLGVIEKVIEDLRELSPALRNIVNTMGKMDTLLGVSQRRLEILEDHLFNDKSKGE